MRQNTPLPDALLGLALLILAPARAEAQAHVVLGLRSGFSTASASFDAEETISKSNRTGFADGVFLDIDLGVLGLQVGGQYAQKGLDLDLDEVVGDLKNRNWTFQVGLGIGSGG